MNLDEIIALHTAGRLEVAEHGYRELVRAGSEIAAVYANLAAICLKTARAAEAVTLLERAIALDPAFAEAHYNLGIARQGRGQLDDAVAAYRQAIALKPDLIGARANLGAALLLRGRTDEAIACLIEVLNLDPKHAEAHNNLGLALDQSGSSEAAIRSFSKAISLNPTDPRFHANLAGVLYATVVIPQALAENRRALELAPDFYPAHVNIGNILKDRGDAAGAIASLRRAVALEPDNPQAYANLLYTYSFTQAVPPAEYLALARTMEQRACAVPASGPTIINRAIDPHRKLRIGILSAEIRAHAVGYFLESYLRHYDRARIELTLYPTVIRNGHRRDALIALADRVRDLAGIDDDAAQAMIMADGIDILVDTTAHMQWGRIALLARRCAPVQCHYIGYHGSTGLSTVDYFIGDDAVTPPSVDGHFSERIWRLPRLWVAYNAPDDAPQPDVRPATEPVCFGSFNPLGKIREPTLALWAGVLNAVPGSRLLLKDRLSADPVSRARVLDTLGAAGIAVERIEFAPHVADWNEHMRLYNRVDIALDPTPLNSGTTAFDTLFMATPLITLRGDWMGGLMSTAILKALGRSDWIAETPAEFVAIAARLAADRAQLAALKRSLRDDVRASQLCDGAGLTRALDAAFVGMAARYNAGRAA